MDLRILLSCFLAGAISQTIKILIAFFHHKKIMLFADGDFPSSHSSLVSALAFSVFLIEGLSTNFFIVLILALIIIKDATGVRYKVGILLKKAKIKSSEGHTIFQVIAGISLGIIITLITFLIYRTYWL
jgi:uncharacterized protein